MTPALARDITSALAPDLRKNGAKGLALTSNVGALKAGDRIEEIDGGLDVVETDLGSLAPGTPVHFFRPSANNRLNFWCELLYCTDYGDPVLRGMHLVGDVLHTVDGGAKQYAGGANFKFILVHAEHTLGVHRAAQAVMETHAMRKINTSLTAWHLTPDARGLEQMSDVVVKNLIGGKDAKDACIDAKAMQSRMLFFFSVHLLNQIVPRLRGDLRRTAKGQAKSDSREA